MLTHQPPLHGTTTLPTSILNLHPGWGGRGGHSPASVELCTLHPQSDHAHLKPWEENQSSNHVLGVMRSAKDTKQTAKNPSPPPPPHQKLH